MATQMITLKLEDKFLKDIDAVVKKENYHNRTEFIRNALREKLSDLEKEEILKSLAKLRGSSRRKTTDDKLHRAGEKAFEMIEKKLKSK